MAGPLGGSALHTSPSHILVCFVLTMAGLSHGAVFDQWHIDKPYTIRSVGILHTDLTLAS